MRVDSPHRYRILLQDKQVGPFDRRTIVGMRLKKLLDNNTPLLRTDGHTMTVAQLVADRFEMADAQAAQLAGEPVGSGLWPTFLVDFGGGWRGAGALGYTGRGELRFQGDTLRLAGQRKGRVFGSVLERVKLPLSGIASATVGIANQSQLELRLKPDQPFPEAGKFLPAVLTLDDMDAVKELIGLMHLSA
jgi:hypothetical protein